VCLGQAGAEWQNLISSSNPGAVQQVQASSRERQCSCSARLGMGPSGWPTEG